jgi:hypothetical protein
MICNTSINNGSRKTYRFIGDNPDVGEPYIYISGLRFAQSECRRVSKIIKYLPEMDSNKIVLTPRVSISISRDICCQYCNREVGSGITITEYNYKKHLCIVHYMNLCNILDEFFSFDIKTSLYDKVAFSEYKNPESGWICDYSDDRILNGDYFISFGDNMVNAEYISELYDVIKDGEILVNEETSTCSYCGEFIREEESIIKINKAYRISAHPECRDKLVKNLQKIIDDKMDKIITDKL